MKQIPLTKGFFALVDDEDFEELSKYKWQARVAKNTVYATTRGYKGLRFSVPQKMHRMVLGLTSPRILCDHVDGNGLNNQKENLRACTASENGKNNKRYSNNKTGYKGVTWDSNAKKFRSTITDNRKTIYIGLFANPIDAAMAYDKAAVLFHGSFANLNFPI